MIRLHVSAHAGLVMLTTLKRSLLFFHNNSENFQNRSEHFILIFSPAAFSGELVKVEPTNKHKMIVGAALKYSVIYAFGWSLVAGSDGNSQCVEGTCPSDDAMKNKPLECHTYMAPSTLGQDTNMGMYTGVDLKKNDVVNWPEIAVPLLFREWGEHAKGFTDGQLWERYIWEGSVVDIETYVETNTEASKAAFIPGIGCTINAVMDMNNIESTHGSKYDTAGLHRSRDPGSGAFSGYHSSITSAATEIPAGSELLAAYGEEWIPDIPGVQVTLDLLMDEADDFLIDEYIPFMQENDKQLSADAKEALWEFTKDFPVYSQAMTNLPRDAWSEVEKFAIESSSAEGQIKIPDDLSIVRHFLRKHYIRPLEWLQTHPNSYCQDHIRPDRSTIEQAGRGAFATRDLPAGTVVGYAPLIHIGKDGREILNIQYSDIYKKGTRYMYDLIINYSFGHPNSTMLLTPYGGMVNYINHAPGSAANVKVRFPDKELIAHKPEWLNRDPEFFHRAIEKIGLSFEYVALRYIKEGEEVFMDYGPLWEQAWEEHIRTWEPLEESENYKHSSEWKEPFFRTHDELEMDPYPENLHTMCLQSYALDDKGEFVFVDVMDTGIKERWYCDVMARKSDGQGGYVYDIDLRIDRAADDDDDDDDDDDEEEDSGDLKETWIFVKDVASSAIFLTDKSFSTDWHLPNAFRHYIQIPDSVMPAAWLNGPDPFQLPPDDEEE